MNKKPVYLVGIDGSNCSGRALEYARQRAKADDGKLLILHVIEWSPYSFSTPQENAERHKRREEELARAHGEVVGPILSRVHAEGIEAEGLVRHGKAADTLARIGEKHGATCIIVGRKGASKLKAKIFGSIASSLVQIADRPVCVVP
jgi:nucleotide-binding universal stress UspA family protein